MNPATHRQAEIIAAKCWTKLASQEQFKVWAANGLDKMLASKLIGPLLKHVRYNSDPDKGMQTIMWAREELRQAGYDPNKHPID